MVSLCTADVVYFVYRRLECTLHAEFLVAQKERLSVSLTQRLGQYETEEHTLIHYVWKARSRKGT